MNNENKIVTFVRVDKKLLTDAKKLSINISQVFAKSLADEIRKRQENVFYKALNTCKRAKVKTSDIVRAIRYDRDTEH